MDSANFPIEFNSEIDDVKKGESEYYDLAVDRLSRLAEGYDDISGAVVNFKQPAKEHETTYTNEVTIVLYMGSNNIAATEKGERFSAALSGALDAVERQVRDRREQQRGH
jgi:ribosome-associated translation inhibitor RaiA